MRIKHSVESQWVVLTPDEQNVERLVRKLNIPDPMARVLVNRGVTDPDLARAFMNPRLEDLQSPEALPHLEAAIERLHQAVLKKEKIVVYGDYDVDGITSTSMLANFLEMLGADLETYIPDRMTEGYGLNTATMATLAARGVNLIVALDLGVGDVQAIAKARELGMDVVVVDHHQVPDLIPDAVALVDPFRGAGLEFFKGLAAVGLTFYLIVEFRKLLRKKGVFENGGGPNLKEDLDLVALGTIADLAPLSGPNRIIAHFGLIEIGKEQRPGIAALKKVAGLGGAKVSAGQVAFQLAPRINAAGRIGSADVAVKLLRSKNREEADKLALKLDSLNRERQEIESKILEKAFEQIEKGRLDKNSAIVVSGRGWHPGVIGIVSSKITDRYGLPSVVVALDEGMGKGSARSVPGLHIYRAIKEAAAHLEGYGGHEMAAGIVIREENIAKFDAMFQKSVEGAAAPLRKSILKIDGQLDIEEDLDGVLVESLNSLAPHGMGNPEPLFVSRNVRAMDAKLVGTNHLKFRMRTVKEGAIQAIAFSQGESLEIARSGPIDLIYTPRFVSTGDRLEIKVRDIRKSQ